MARMASCRLSRNHNARNQSRSAETHTSSLCTITPGSATAQRALMYEASARSRARAVAGPEGVGHRSRLRPHQSMRTRSSSAASAARAAARAAGNACRPPASYRCRARSMSSVKSFGRSSRARSTCSAQRTCRCRRSSPSSLASTASRSSACRKRSPRVAGAHRQNATTPYLGESAVEARPEVGYGSQRGRIQQPFPDRRRCQHGLRTQREPVQRCVQHSLK